MNRKCSIFAVLFLLSCGLGTGFAADAVPSKTIPHYLHNYYFSWDWFTHNIPLWKRELGHLKGRPNLRYLEIGTHEGRSALWILENILTDPTSKMTGIDPYVHATKIFSDNLRIGGLSEKVTMIDGYSQEELKHFPPHSFDLIYVDGSHFAKDVLIDALLSWKVLKTGGILIFDDYKWEGQEGRLLPPLSRPQMAIDAFLFVFRNNVKIIHQDYQVLLKKIREPHSYRLNAFLSYGVFIAEMPVFYYWITVPVLIGILIVMRVAPWYRRTHPRGT